MYPDLTVKFCDRGLDKAILRGRFINQADKTPDMVSKAWWQELRHCLSQLPCYLRTLWRTPCQLGQMHCWSSHALSTA